MCCSCERASMPRPGCTHSGTSGFSAIEEILRKFRESNRTQKKTIRSGNATPKEGLEPPTCVQLVRFRPVLRDRFGTPGGTPGEDVPKSGKARTVPFSDQAAAVLDRISRREHFTGAISCSRTNSAATPTRQRSAALTLALALQSSRPPPRRATNCPASRSTASATASVPLRRCRRSRPGWATLTSRPRWSTSTSCRTLTTRRG